MRSTIRRDAGLVVGLLTMLATASHAQGQSVVTDELLLDPSPEVWVTYGRDYAETHHSPLTAIDTSNVGRLGLAWSVEVGSDGKVETTPLVFDGVMYGTTTWSTVFAIDVRTRTLKWKWDPGLVRGGIRADGPRACCGPVNRGVALYEGRVFVGLLDGRLVALDAETGEVEWAVQTTPAGTDYSITGAPRVVDGKVIIGQGGAEFGVRGYLTAYDAETGDQVWRFYVVPGDPSLGFENATVEWAAETWHDGEWWTFGGGGTPWDGIAYDPEENLVYVGTGNGTPWNRDFRSPGGGDNLFLASIVALDATTGEYVWHYQTTPGDHWDYNSAQTMILADLEIDGTLRKVIMQAPKNGFFYVLDRVTGEFISGEPYAIVTWASGIDPETGRPIETPEARYGLDPVSLSPSFIGAHHYPPMAFNPATGLVYFPGQETSAVFQATETLEYEEGAWNLGIRMDARRGGEPDPLPPSARQPIPTQGFIVAWDPIAQMERWRIEVRPSGGMLSTAGGLVFSSDSSGRLMALDAGTGETLWEERLLPGVATPITYELDGRQYVAVLSGTSDGRIFSFALDADEPMPGAP